MSLIKVAVASKSEVNVDTHFGEARKYLIFEIDTESETIKRSNNINVFIDNQEESQSCKIPKKCGAHNSGKAIVGGCVGHNDEKINKIAKQLSNCNYIFVKKIGPKPQKILLRYNINCLETDLPIKEAIDRLAHYLIKIK